MQSEFQDYIVERPLLTATDYVVLRMLDTDYGLIVTGRRAPEVLE